MRLNQFKFFATIGMLLFAFADVFAEDRARAKLVGTWEETHPGTNLVTFVKDGTWTLYLKKDEIGDQRSLNGTWTLSGSGQIRIVATLEGRTHLEVATLSFVGDEMLLVDQQGNEIRHRRYDGPIPDRYSG